MGGAQVNPDNASREKSLTTSVHSRMVGKRHQVPADVARDTVVRLSLSPLAQIPSQVSHSLVLLSGKRAAVKVNRLERALGAGRMEDSPGLLQGSWTQPLGSAHAVCPDLGESSFMP